MKNRFILTTVAVLLSAAFSATAQNNAYGLDDECYDLFMKCEQTYGTTKFGESAEKLLQAALKCGDTKAQTLYYVEMLKHQTRLVPSGTQTTQEQDNEVLRLQQKVKDVADELGYKQYFYYSYEIVQNYFYNHKKDIKVIELSKEMQSIARERNDEYGLWMSYRYMVALYIDESDYISAKPYILQALKLYDVSTDPVVRRQSVTRLYCDLADTYMIGSDSLSINIEKAVAARKTHFDTLRCEYYLAKISAYYNDLDAYRTHRDYCIGDPSLSLINNTNPKFFHILDAILDKSFNIGMIDMDEFSHVREMKFIANIAETHGFTDEAFYVEKQLVKRYEGLFASTNRTSISEFDSRLGNYILHNELNIKDTELDSKAKELSHASRVMSILLIVILATVLAFLLLHQHSLVRHNRQLRDANEKVTLANAAKTRFVQNMSHEVRTPLNAIVGFSQLLSLPDGTFSEQEKEEFTGHIVNNTKMLTMLLDDILNASAIDSGKYTITPEPAEVHSLCQAAISSTEHRLQPGVTMTYAPESQDPIQIVADPRRIQQILINLLTNACKHTTSGSIVLSSSTTAEPGFVRFTVTDTGTGVPPEMAEAIFGRFTKLNEFVQGTGLGLSICRDIAERMGARVYLDTTWPGPGARFIFSVPVNPPVTNTTE